jgi:hypothetical protein
VLLRCGKSLGADRLRKGINFVVAEKLEDLLKCDRLGQRLFRDDAGTGIIRLPLYHQRLIILDSGFKKPSPICSLPLSGGDMLSGVVFIAKRRKADWASLVVIDVFFVKREGGKLVEGNRNATCAKY